jgi:tRNA U55 pseudouridine synthase TruB
MSRIHRTFLGELKTDDGLIIKLYRDNDSGEISHFTILPPKQITEYDKLQDKYNEVEAIKNTKLILINQYKNDIIKTQNEFEHIKAKNESLIHHAQQAILAQNVLQDELIKQMAKLTFDKTTKQTDIQSNVANPIGPFSEQIKAEKSNVAKLNNALKNTRTPLIARWFDSETKIDGSKT